MEKKGRLERVRAYLEQKGWEYEYHEEDGCGSIDFSYRGVPYHIWEFEEDGAFFQVWLEDEQSLRAKLQVMEKYGIGGAAAWKLGYEAGHPEVWDAISDFADS